MRHPMLTRAALAAAVISALAAPVPAHAQFGKLLKKAKHAVDPATPDQTSGRGANGAPVRYSETVLELDATRVGKFIGGLEAKAHSLSTADGIGVAAMNERVESIGRQIGELDDWDEAAYEKLVEQHSSCMADAMADAARSHQAERTAMVMDRSFAQKQAVAAQEASRAMQRGDTAEANRLVRGHRPRVPVEGIARGDTAEANRLVRELQAPMAAMAHQDSVEALKKCPVPVKPPALVAFDSLNTLAQRLTERIRAVQGEADSIAAQRSGMTRQQYDAAKERVLAYLGGSRNGLGKAELAALDARHDEIERLARAIHEQGAGW